MNRSNRLIIWVSDEIVTFGSDFVLFGRKNSIGQKQCALPSEKLNLAWNLYTLFEMVGVCLDYAWFSWNSWTGLWIFVEYWQWINIGQEETLQLKIQIIAIFICRLNRCDWIFQHVRIRTHCIWRISFRIDKFGPHYF